MADADPLLDPYLDEEDKKLVEDVEAPEVSMGGPVPEGLDAIAPDADVATEVAPAAAPATGDEDLDRIAALAQPAPDPVATAAGAPMDAAQAVTARTQEAEGLAKRQGALDQQRATVNAATAARVAEDARVADEDARLERADYLERRQAAERDLDARIKNFEQHKDIQQPRNTFKSKLSVIFGGLGAAFRSAGGGDSRNTALANLQKQWETEIDVQKANIAAARDSVIQARTRLADIDEGRRNMMRDADARLVGKYNAAIRQGEAQLKNHGIPQAQIDADARILKLREGRDAALAKARLAEDQHALTQARAAALKAQAERRGTPDDLRQAQIRVMNARAGILERRAKGGGGVSAKEKRAQEKHEADQQRKSGETEIFDAETGASLGHAPTKERATVAAKRLEQLDVVRGDAARLKQHIDEKGPVAPSVPLIGNVTDASRTRQALANKLVTDVSGFQNLGAISKDDKKIIDGVIAGGSSYVLGMNSKQLDELMASLERAKASALRAQGVTPPAASTTAAAPTKAGAGGFVVGQTRKLANGTTVRITSADGDYVVVSSGRR